MRSIARALVLFGIVAATAACGSDGGGGGTTCTEIGCNDQVLIRPLSPSGTLITSVQGVVTADGEALTVNCVSGGTSSAKVLCLPDGVAIQGQPTSLKIALSSGDLASAAPEVTPSYQKVQPNGPKCEPTCMQASVDVSLGGGLTDVVNDSGGGGNDGGGGTDAGPNCGDAKVCCCDMDAVTAPICTDTGAWQCPKGYGLFTGADCDLGGCGGPCNTPCPDVSGDADTADTSDTSDTDDKDTTDPDAGDTCCTGSEDCPAGHCIQGVCYQLSELGKDQCWVNGDCASGASCEGVVTCPCGQNCFVPSKPGTCKETPKPGACCSSGASCGAGLFCAGDACKLLADLGSDECWGDAQCKEGEACEGAQVCACGASCLVPDKKGVCKAKPASCTKVDPNGYGTCEMVLGVGWDGSKCTTVSGCSCPAPCSELFSTLDDCQKACSK